MAQGNRICFLSSASVFCCGIFWQLIFFKWRQAELVCGENSFISSEMLSLNSLCTLSGSLTPPTLGSNNLLVVSHSGSCRLKQRTSRAFHCRQNVRERFFPEKTHDISRLSYPHKRRTWEYHSISFIALQDAGYNSSPTLEWSSPVRVVVNLQLLPSIRCEFFPRASLVQSTNCRK